MKLVWRMILTEKNHKTVAAVGTRARKQAGENGRPTSGPCTLKMIGNDQTAIVGHEKRKKNLIHIRGP
jgi:hypothetical protein